MSFVIFATWVLVGILAGVLARTLIYAPDGMVPVAVAACIGAALPLVLQRRFWPTEAAGQEKGRMWMDLEDRSYESMAYITSPYRSDTLRIPVWIGGRP